MNTAILSLFALLFLVACKEVFYADDIVSKERIPVIQGIILEGKYPEVRLTWATNYEGNGIDYISGAMVRIYDDLGNEAFLEAAGNGLYNSSSGDFRGQRGRSYTLHVELPSGVIFESLPERIAPPAELDSLYAVPVEKTEYELSPAGNLIGREKEGLEIMTALSRATDSVCYYRFRTDVLTEITYTLNPNSLRPIDVYEWRSSILDRVFDVEYTYQVGALQVIPEHQLGFLEFVFNSLLNSDASTAPYTFGWVVSMHVYSISVNVYNYYNSIAQQLNGTNLIFAPVPSQIKGNVICISDEDEKVIGVFEAGSERIIYKAFAWRNKTAYFSMDLDTFPDGLQNGRRLTIPPDFWVDPY